MKRSISMTQFERLDAQAEEADYQGFDKVAEHLTELMSEASVRDEKDFYVYSAEDFKKDVELSVWNIICRTADYHGKNFDALKIQSEIVEKFAEEIVEATRKSMKIKTSVGAHEASVPGEEFNESDNDQIIL